MFGTKADILRCLKKETPRPVRVPVVKTKLLDGAAIVQMLNPGTAKTFRDYADIVFTSYIFSSRYSQLCGRHLGCVQAR